MVKDVHFFTEMAYSAYSQDRASQYGYTSLMLPNDDFSPERANELYGMYFEEVQYCIESGFDGIMINEHHNNPMCMMPSINVIGAILAKMTEKGKIVFLGNILPIHENPLRLAEEIAMIDVISGGRVICGFVRGVGQESMANNANPVHNRERFEEAHDIIVKTWTTPGPFRWEGKYFNYRVVNPWMMPLQKPHPPIWIPGISSPESIAYAARHRYPYICLAPPLHQAVDIIRQYDEVAKEEGYTPTDEHRGFVVRVNVADSDEKAYEEGKHFYWMHGTAFGLTPSHWATPPGYQSRAAAAFQAQNRPDIGQDLVASKARIATSDPYADAQGTYQVITGNPDTVTRRLKDIIDVADPASLIIWGREGLMSHKTAMRSIELMGQEIIPAIKEHVSKRAQ